jgi:uncharacterized 2Fe-2S/4Fe-4S cluster protein (DUF4445 family)
MEKAKLIFQPSGRRGEVDKGLTIIAASRLLGADIEALCREKKKCGKCKVRIEEGFFEKFGIQSGLDHINPWLEEEAKFINEQEKKAGYRLGCVVEVEGDRLIFVPTDRRLSEWNLC